MMFLILLATFASGACALVYQIVWQQYLSVLVGSDALSISLVIGFFLFGLTSGYRYWEQYTQGSFSRQRLLRHYGYCEFVIALYAIAFPNLFKVASWLQMFLPNGLIVDSLFVGLLLFLPTFLMGATIPILTAVIPTRMAAGFELANTDAKEQVFGNHGELTQLKKGFQNLPPMR